MKLPEGIADKVEELGIQWKAGMITRQDAITALRDVLRSDADQPLQLGIFADFAGRTLDSWARTHAGAAPPPAAGRAPEVAIQSELFPDLPVKLLVQPGRKKALILCTGHDWDAARAMVQARCKGAIKGAQDDLAQFEAAYTRVRPLLKGDTTTAEVADKLRDTRALAAT